MNRSAVSRLTFGVAATVTVAGAVTGADTMHRIAKPFIVPALALGVPRWDPLLGTALAAATVGDVLMLEPDDDARIMRGAGAFAVMQSFYCALLASRGARPSMPNAAPRLIGWAAAAVLLARRSPAVAPTLAGYGLTLGTMSTLAADPALAPGAKTRAGVVMPGTDSRSRLALGGVLFTVSDALIVVRRAFLRRESHRRVAEGAVLATYAAAQLLLVEGLTREK
ncbi:MAG: lysoplasmalogenase [Rhodococcus sp. (in: high G+C Gram-positive bacteria)]